MTTYARIIGGVAVDVAITPPSLSEQFNPEWLSRQVFIQVPDGTRPGAKDNGDGTFTNTSPVAPQSVPKVLAWADLSAYLVGLLGGGTSGRTALGNILKSCQASASGADTYFASYMQNNGTFSKTDFVAVLADVSTAIVSAPAKASVAAGWPVVQV